MERKTLSVLLLFAGVTLVSSQADKVDFIAQNFQPKFSVVTNWASDDPNVVMFEGELAITNAGDAEVAHGDWEIFFCHIRLFEPGILTPNYTDGIPLGSTNLVLYHINGCLYRLKPSAEFRVAAGETIKTNLLSSDWMVARTDVMPNWYVSTTDGATVATIVYTEGEELQHVGPFDAPEKWKRMEGDKFNPFTAQDRYSEYPEMDQGSTPNRLLPSPLEVTLDWSSPIATDDTWQIVRTAGQTDNEAQHLAAATGWTVVATAPGSKFVQLVIDGSIFQDSACENNTEEAYSIEIPTTGEHVMVTAATNAGIFYGVQTVLGVRDLHGDESFYPGSVLDCPRFPFRGFMIDVSRNFLGKGTILDMLDVMATYKLNKFHFHLSDDEGWRLQIPDLEELTEIGGEQCHNLAEDECLIPQLGSDPTRTDRTYYTQSEYIEILQRAKELHIEVIPEFDMPGHAHSAIKAMEARFHRLNATDPAAASAYLLSDLADKSLYLSVQLFKDSALNPCIASTATFIRKVIQEVHIMHQSAQVPLLHYHFGGDEVPGEAWKGSPVCQDLMDRLGFTDNSDIKRYFYDTVVNASHAVDESLALGSWEDGIMDADSNPFPVVQAVDVYTNCWSNVWEWGHGERAYKFANNDYKVVLSHATHLYYDHPQEPDPYARGYYWATRVTNTEKTFGYMPDDIYANIDIDRMGNPLTEEDVCGGECLKLQEGKRHNILGIQGHLFSETTRSEEILHDMVLPRLLALAERAWHKADWESMQGGDRDTARRADWVGFASLLGHHELTRLNRPYHLRPPGATVSDGQLVAKAEFPGLTVEYRLNAADWQDFTSPVNLPLESNNIVLRTKSADGRTSREATLSDTTQGSGCIHPTIGLILTAIGAIMISKTR